MARTAGKLGRNEAVPRARVPASNAAVPPFEALLAQAPGEAWVYDVDFKTLAYVNPAACLEQGLSVDDLKAREALFQVVRADLDKVRSLARDAVAGRQRSAPYLIGQTRPDASRYSVEMVVSPFANGDRITHVVLWARNVSEQLQETRDRALRLKLEMDARARAETERERLQFLSDASRQLATSLDYLSTLACVARLSVPRLGTWCIVDVLMDDDTLRREAVAHQEPFKVLLACELQQHGAPPPGAPSAIWSVLTAGRPRVLAGQSLEDIEFAHDARSIELSKDLGVRSCILVPLLARGRTLGCLTLCSSERAFGARDLETAEALGRYAGLALDNAVLYRDCSAVAQTLERSLMLPQLPRIAGVELALHYQPAHHENSVGGDFYDVCETVDGRWSVAIGDIRGKGLPAAALTALVRYTLRAAALQAREPSQALSLLNQALVRQETNRRSCTAVYALLEKHRHGFKMKLACAGHPLPLVLRRNGEVQTAGRSGRLMGLYPHLAVEDDVITLEPGDTILFYTDGLTEARRQGDIFEAHLPAVLAECAGRDAHGIVETLEKRVIDWHEEGPRDDMALLVVRIRPEPRRHA